MIQQIQWLLRWQWQIGMQFGVADRILLLNPQPRPLGLGSTALHLQITNYSPLEKQLLCCYWALVETENLTVGHQVTM